MKLSSLGCKLKLKFRIQRNFKLTRFTVHTTMVAMHIKQNHVKAVKHKIIHNYLQ